MNLKSSLLTLGLLLFGVSAFSQAKVAGRWKTIDDETGQPKSIVELYEQGGKLFGKVIKLLNKPQDAICEPCTGDLKGKKIVGMVIVKDMVLDDDEWEDGTIFDPKKAKTYSCKLWLADAKTLKVRGYLGPFFRTQTWYREE